MFTRRDSVYLAPLEQPVEVRWINDDGVTMSYGLCFCRNEILDAWLTLGLDGVNPDNISCVPPNATNTPHMAKKP